MTLIANLFAGPGAGKSTMAASVFAKLKRNHVEAELVTEFAKDLTWEVRREALQCQPYVFGEQLWRLHRLIGKVDVIVTDSPILLSVVYGSRKESFNAAAYDVFNDFQNLNFLLDRDRQYSPNGRNQTEEEAKALDRRIEDTLRAYNVPFDRVRANDIGAIYVKERILERLDKQDAFIDGGSENALH